MFIARHHPTPPPLRSERHVNRSAKAHGAPPERGTIKKRAAINILLLRSKQSLNQDFSCKASLAAIYRKSCLAQRRKALPRF
jgi:hypothetical protein